MALVAYFLLTAFQLRRMDQNTLGAQLLMHDRAAHPSFRVANTNGAVARPPFSLILKRRRAGDKTGHG